MEIKIETLDELKKVFTDPTKTSFEELAKALINNFCIIKHDTRNNEELVYRFIEIESYYYNSEKPNEEVNTINRDCKAGEWFFHNSGVDIAYKTIIIDNELTKFGGILLRGIEIYKLINDKCILKGVIGGPRLVMQEIFSHTDEMPKICQIHKDIKQYANIKYDKRIGFKDESTNDYRAIAEGVNWNMKFEQITEDKNHKVIYKETNKPYKYKL